MRALKPTLSSYLLLGLSLFYLSCDPPSETSITGDLNVRVVLNGFTTVQGANVYTNPPSIQALTDEFGTALLIGIEEGSYEVFAEYSEVGTGKSAIRVMEDELTEVTINIIEGIDVGLAPSLNVILPVVPAEFAESEAVNFSIDVVDDKSSSEKINVSVKSNLDGEIFTGSPDVNNNVSFTLDNLSRGYHTISIVATDEDGYEGYSTLFVSTQSPRKVNLEEATRNSSGAIELNWSEFDGNSFEKYDVFRVSDSCTAENPTLLATITDIGTTSFTDRYAPFTEQVCYYVRVSNTENYTRNSNFVSYAYPNGDVFIENAYDFVVHPTQDFAYILNWERNKLTKYNLTTFEIESTQQLEGTSGYIDIGTFNDITEIYVPGSDGWVYIYSAEDLSRIDLINTGLSNSSVVTNNDGLLIVAMRPSPWWEQPVRIFSRASGEFISGNGDFEGDRLRMIPGKNQIISISQSVSPTDMEYFSFSNDGSSFSHSDDQYHGDHPLNAQIFRVSDSGNYTVTSGSGAVYSADQAMNYLGVIQRGDLWFSDFAFSDDGSVIYAATSNRNSIQLAQYPSLTREDEILIKGYPLHIVRKGDFIYSYSRSEETGNEFGIEVIDLSIED